MGQVGPLLALVAGEFVASKAAQHFAGGPPPPPKTVPMPDTQLINQAQQQEASMALRRTGRSSTILTTNADTGDRLGP